MKNFWNMPRRKDAENKKYFLSYSIILEFLRLVYLEESKEKEKKCWHSKTKGKFTPERMNVSNNCIFFYKLFYFKKSRIIVIGKIIWIETEEKIFPRRGKKRYPLFP